MIIYSIIMFLVAALFIGLGIAIYFGKTELIHDYHRTKVTDTRAYGRAFGRGMLVIAVSMLISGIVGLFSDENAFAIVAVSILALGLTVGICIIVFVQRKYNKGIF